MLSAVGNIVLLGDPGAGKTTTLKRIARLALDAPVSSSDTSEYPIVVRLRDIDFELLLEESLGRAMGIATERKLPEIRYDSNNNPFETQVRTIEATKILSHNRLAIDAIAEIANDSGALFLLDGLDELRPELRGRTERTVVELSRRCDKAKIRLTCRSGDYVGALEGFDALELCPLDQNQIADIVDRWCAAPAEFAAALRHLPFKDLASRPLFLCELIVLFDKSGFLPQQPSAVYRRVVILALEEWDRSKRVERRSRYAGFDPVRKFEFLAELAYYLTYNSAQKFFTPETFAQAYEAIRSSFVLPAGDAGQVFNELESHTGIIVESGFERYEFSHLSLQEFLAADYLVRDRVGKETVRQMLTNPAPIAISVAMSSNPGQRLAAILLNPWVGASFKDFNLDSFFARIAQESAAFREDILVGFAALAIVFNARCGGVFVEQFLAAPVVQRSIGLALAAYSAKERKEQEGLDLRLQPKWQQSYDVALPRGGFILRARVEPIMEACELRLHQMQTFHAGHSAYDSRYRFLARPKSSTPTK